MTAGRPSKYDPAYCDEVVELGKQGKSPAQMAAHFDVARTTMLGWADEHPEFSTALTRAMTHCQAWWEEEGVKGLWGRDFNAPVWKKSVESRFRDDYTERKEVGGPGGGALQVVISSDDDAL